MLEAIIAMPDQLFYNTGISTYIWIVTDRKSKERKGKVQLINATGGDKPDKDNPFYFKMMRSLGSKRKEMGDGKEGRPAQIAAINKITEQRHVQKVVIDVDRDIIKYFGEQKYYNGFVKEEEAGDNIRMTFLSGSLTGFARWFMLFGDKAKIIEPLRLNDIVVEIAGNILKKIEDSQMLLT